MNNVEREVDKLYERSSKLRSIASHEDEGDEHITNKPASTQRNRRIIRVMMLLVGVGLIAYGLLSMVFKPGTERVQATPAPSAGAMNSSQTFTTCEDAMTAINEGTVTHTSAASQGISAEEAEQISDQLLTDYLEFDDDMYPTLLAGPALVDVLLPDGTNTQAWSRIWVPQLRDENQDPTSATRGVDAHVLYISSQTGDPILLVRGVTLQDPLLAGCDEIGVQEFFERVKTRGSKQLLGTILNVSLFVVGIAILGFWQRTR